MVITDEDALICDFAETYGIYDYRKLPLRKAAVLASGLRDDARIKMKISGMNMKIETILLASIADRTGLNVWMQSKDGAKGKNRPASVLDKMLNMDEKKEDTDTVAFHSGQEFDDEWQRIAGR